MTTPEEKPQDVTDCPQCIRPLLESAHDGHQFCPECGFQIITREVENAEDSG